MTQVGIDLLVAEVGITTSAGAYADDDQIGSLNTLTDVFVGAQRKATIDSVSVVDLIKQKAALTLLFFDAAPTVTSTDNATLNIADAEMSGKCVGKIEIAASDYGDLSANSVASVTNLGLIVSSESNSLYCILQSAGTPTYGSAEENLKLRIGIRRG